MHLLKGKGSRSRSQERIDSQEASSTATPSLSTPPGSNSGSTKAKRIVASAYKAFVEPVSHESWPSLAPELPTDKKPATRPSMTKQLLQPEHHQVLVKTNVFVESESGCPLVQHQRKNHRCEKRENLLAESLSTMRQEQMAQSSRESRTAQHQAIRPLPLTLEHHTLHALGQEATNLTCPLSQSINPRKTPPPETLKHRYLANNHQPVPTRRHRVPPEPGEKFVARSISLLGMFTSNGHLEESSADCTTASNVSKTGSLLNRGLRTVSAPILLGLKRVSHRRPSHEILYEDRPPIDFSNVTKARSRATTTCHEELATRARLLTQPDPSTADPQTTEEPRERGDLTNQMSQSWSSNSDSSEIQSIEPDLPTRCDHTTLSPPCRACTSSTSTAMITAQAAVTAGLNQDSRSNGSQYQNLIGDHHSNAMGTPYPVNGSPAPYGGLSLSHCRPEMSSKLRPEAAAEFQSPTHLRIGPRLAHRNEFRVARVRAVKSIPANETLPHEERMDLDPNEAEMMTCETSTACSTHQGSTHEYSTHQKKRNSTDRALTSIWTSSETIPCNETCAQNLSTSRVLFTRSRANKQQSTVTPETVKTMRPRNGNSRSEARRQRNLVAMSEGRRSDENASGSEANDYSPSNDSVSLSGSSSTGLEYETPTTSPEHSPFKLAARKMNPFEWAFSQLDGSKEVGGHIWALHCEGPDPAETRSGLDKGTISNDNHLCEDKEDSEDKSGLLNSSSREPTRQTATASERHSQLDDIDMMDCQARSIPTNNQQVAQDDMTPLGPASPAKSAHPFPFPAQPERRAYTTSTLHTRRPSALLEHCERYATPLQRRLMASGVQSVDRFVPSRNATPTKEALHLPKAEKQSTPPGSRAFVRGRLDDPFGPAPRRSLRMAEQYATVRHPPPAPRAIGMIGSRVQEAQPSNNRAASAGTIWSVGGTVVTEGVASVTNGRGGRITSGSNATHFVADFLRKSSRSEEEITHGRRLALAMDITPKSRMMEQSSPSSPLSSEGKRVWKDGAWKVDGDVSPTKSTPKKAKEVPVIPFRVLNAPSLRDDYYCSLLAYSPTVECLAVGLGPHVYLWSENRGPKNIPDSFTVTAGSAHVTSLSFSSEEGGNAILAIGRADGRITLWSPLDRDPRFDSDQPAPVSCVCFRPTTVNRQSLRDPIATVATEELLVGDELGSVYYYSVEWPNQDQRDLFDWHGRMTLLARITCHAQQICGIAWSPNGDYFATGGNDNHLLLFESKKVLRPSAASSSNAAPTVHVRDSSSTSSNATVTGRSEVLSVMPGQERHTFTLNAAVKAIAFAPWQTSLLAAGGGSNDRCIHFFHTLSGAALATIDCHAQVTSLVWSVRRREIAATFGFAQPEHPYRVAVFAWPGCAMVIGIPWFGEERALFAVAYPRGPNDGQSHRSGRPRRGAADASAKPGKEGEVWYGKRTREEGCLVVATSDASIKFHEIWAERPEESNKRRASGALGGSQILEGECSLEFEALHTIR